MRPGVVVLLTERLLRKISQRVDLNSGKGLSSEKYFISLASKVESI